MSSFAVWYSRCAVLLAARQWHLLSRRILPSDRSRVQKGGAEGRMQSFPIVKNTLLQIREGSEDKAAF